MPSNLVFYPYNSPIVLTDAIFVAHGGQEGASLAPQRSVAFVIAEERVSAHIGTLLRPTVVTGTFSAYDNPILTDYAYVRRLLGVTLWSQDGSSSCGLSSDSACAYLRDATYGVLDINYGGSCYGGCGSGFTPYQVEVAYEAGLASGTVYQASFLRALVVEAQIELNEMGAASINESVGDIGVQGFSNQSYSEQRVKLRKTALGSSAMSNYAERLLRRYKLTRKVGF